MLIVSLLTPPDHTIMVEADENKLAQVVRNLVSNALKFTPAGGTVTATVGYEKTQSSPTYQLVFRVTDTGTGMSAVGSCMHVS